MNTKEKRLKFYKQMLKDYTKSFFHLGKKMCNTSWGFCFYIDNTLQSDWTIHDFIELYAQKPKKTYYNGFYWFKHGRRIPRIVCILKAIKLCKDGKS